jgi:hypothetical protein
LRFGLVGSGAGVVLDGRSDVGFGGKAAAGGTEAMAGIMVGSGSRLWIRSFCSSKRRGIDSRRSAIAARSGEVGRGFSTCSLLLTGFTP